MPLPLESHPRHITPHCPTGVHGATWSTAQAKFCYTPGVTLLMTTPECKSWAWHYFSIRNNKQKFYQQLHSGEEPAVFSLGDAQALDILALEHWQWELRGETQENYSVPPQRQAPLCINWLQPRLPSLQSLQGETRLLRHLHAVCFPRSCPRALLLLGSVTSIGKAWCCGPPTSLLAIQGQYKCYLKSKQWVHCRE